MSIITRIEHKSKTEILLIRVLFISVFTFMIAASAFIKIPIYPVPFTMQTLFVLLAANILGKKDGTISQLLYLTVGLSGIPIFANGGGPGYVFQPSFGYILGFIPAAYLSGIMSENIDYTKSKNAFAKLITANLVALGIIYIFGLTYLYVYSSILFRNITIYQIVYSGFILFIPAMILKLFAASFITFWFKKYKH